MNKSNPNVYFQIQNETEKPIKLRKALEIGAHGTKRIPRKYHLTQHELDKLQYMSKNAAGAFQNPYKRKGLHWGIIQSLINLGINRRHSFSSVKNELKQVLSKVSKNGVDAWSRFLNKRKDGHLCAHDENGRIIEGCRLLNRVSGYNPYGLKLRQMRACLNIYRDQNGFPEYELRTDYATFESAIPYRE